MIDKKKIKSIIKGAITFVPFVNLYLNKKKSKTKYSGSNAEFCYSLWLSMLVHFDENNFKPTLKKIGEIGNGGSLGVGICALLTGTEEYFSFELNNYIDREQNLRLLDEIVTLFKNQKEIKKYEQLNIKINNYKYPSNLISQLNIDETFINEIKTEIENKFENSKRIKIINNYTTQNTEIDFVFSRAVMEHVLNPETIYRFISENIKTSTSMFHDIEFHSHNVTNNINGHYKISKFIWKIIFGNRKYFLNRWDLTKHLNSIKENNFEIIKVAENYKKINNQEEVCIGTTIIAKRKAL